MISDQLILALDWGKEPWGGVSPRHLTRGSCVVDKSVVRCGSREATEILELVDPAQYAIFLKGSPNGS